jgi:hypothetical protein
MLQYQLLHASLSRVFDRVLICAYRHQSNCCNCQRTVLACTSRILTNSPYMFNFKQQLDALASVGHALLRSLANMWYRINSNGNVWCPYRIMLVNHNSHNNTTPCRQCLAVWTSPATPAAYCRHECSDTTPLSGAMLQLQGKSHLSRSSL